MTEKSNEQREESETKNQIQSGALTKRIVDVWPWMLVALAVAGTLETVIFIIIVKAKLEEKKQNEIKRAYQDEAIDKIVDKSTMELPDAMIDTQCENMINQFAQQMAQQGLSMDQYLQFSGLTIDQLKEQVRPDAITRIKSSLVLEQIAKEENIEITDEDVDAEIEKMAKMYNMEADKLKEYMGEDEKENMKQDLAVQKAGMPKEVVNYVSTTVEKNAEDKNRYRLGWELYKVGLSVPAQNQLFNIDRTHLLELGKIAALKEQFESQDTGCDDIDLTRSAYPVELGTRHPLSIVRNMT